ncbi:MAG: DUF3303 family protein [Candidatus Nitrosocaldus sp.]|nr:hypothetical protein [Candidatus Nitrosocaldus sp.]MCS7141395.1 hypothetical protein [Candidatus Nitrosocaldus sp.]MDW8000757.1 DUF3303 family protein [Candidatus Nitrosocaldus sp.]MDW8275702.1 DUF3303 family protein [Candidatus Nitrosocaldus sp.]
MSLYGLFGEHSVESCPLYNERSRRAVLSINERLDEVAKKHNVKFLGMYHSALEHTFVWIADADDAHRLQRFAMDVDIASFNALKIVPLGTFNDLVAACKRLQTQS